MCIRKCALSNRNICWPFQHSLNEYMQGLRKRLAFALRNGGLFPEKARRKPGPGWSFVGKCGGSSAEDQGIGTIERGTRRVLEVFLRRVDDCEIQAGLQELQ